MLDHHERTFYAVFFGVILILLLLLATTLYKGRARRHEARGRILENPLSGPLEIYPDV